MNNMKRPSRNNKSCFEMLEEDCKGCDNAIPIDGDYCGTLRGFEKGRLYERKKIMKIVDGANDIAQAMYLLGQYIIGEELNE